MTFILWKAHLKSSTFRISSTPTTGINHRCLPGNAVARKCGSWYEISDRGIRSYTVLVSRSRLSEHTQRGAMSFSSQGAVSANLPNTVLMALPKRSTLAWALQRHWQRWNEGIILPPTPVDRNFDIPKSLSEMFIFDSRAGSEWVIILSCKTLSWMYLQEQTCGWLMASSLQCQPSFSSSYSIHLQLCSVNNPAALYCLL